MALGLKCVEGLVGRLRKYNWSYEKTLSDDSRLYRELEKVRDEIWLRGIILDVSDEEYRNSKAMSGQHYMRGVLADNNRFEIKTFCTWLPWKNYIRLSASRGDEYTGKLKDIIDEVV